MSSYEPARPNEDGGGGLTLLRAVVGGCEGELTAGTGIQAPRWPLVEPACAMRGLNRGVGRADRL